MEFVHLTVALRNPFRQVTVKGHVKWQNAIFPGGMIKVLSNLII